jgi:prepilin-type N-terminal cleavage/methylation domain-containing protein
MKLKSGFSLIELLVVVAIIGILAAIGTVGYNKYIAGAKTAAGTASVKVLADALIAEDSNLADCKNSTTPNTCATALAATNNIALTTTCASESDNGKLKVVGAGEGDSTNATISYCDNKTWTSDQNIILGHGLRI